ncbi:MAG: hypothetical protein NT018_07300 [Armatimonadetes bacterium]|nr:hypothetical protein [Armatimonadota bacterium]
MTFKKSALAVGLTLLCAQAFAGTGTVSIDASKKGFEISPKMYGIFLEEINYGVDGGLYAEMVKNRAFEGNNPPEGGEGRFTSDPSGLPDWSLVQSGAGKGAMFADIENPLNPNTPHSLRFEVDNASGGRIGVANGGFWGMSAVKGEKYNVSLWARSADGFRGPLTVGIEDAKGRKCSTQIGFTAIGPEWTQFNADIKGTATNPRARLVITAGSKGTVWLDMVSLMPAKTWKGLPLRADIAQMIADLQPKFVRFPGGCVVEGYSVKDAYNWKQTIGKPEERQECFNAWDYRRTHGMGMYEYMRFIEEMKSQPLFVLFAGDSCVFRGSEHVAPKDMGWVIDNYMDYIEYATGPAASKWGAIRAKAGHPKPFETPMIGIGNETWTDQYWTNYPVIYKTIKDKYPDITTIACMEKDGVPIDMMDNHYYFSARWFLNTQTYDKYDRKKAPVYCGEVASPNELTERGHNILAALAESVFMLNCEKNADVVKMISYAPLVANSDYKDAPWHGCINFDTSRIFGTPSYYAQKVFSTNCPTYNVATDLKYEVEKPETVPGCVAFEFKKMAGEVKDYKVEKDGRPLTVKDFLMPEGWENKDGVLSTTNGGTFKYGDPSWEDYTVSAKVKFDKLLDEKENEFKLHFGLSDKMDCALNIYGSGTKSQITGCDNAYGEKPVNMNDGNWHEVKVEIKGLHVRAWVDGQLTHEIDMRVLYKLAVGAGMDAKTGELIIKVVNTHPESIKTTLNIAGVSKIDPKAQITVMKGDSLKAKNTLNEPKKVVPVATKLDGVGPSFKYEFAPNSLTVIRVKAK